ncbi:MAG: VWA domain-containing protein [Clostridia bacterium]|nr:VWA domain-containing protein [Clostridia bacterium]
MIKRVQKIFICLFLVFVIISSNSPIFARNIDFPIKKEATNLDENFDTKVTLSINPDPEDEKIIDIVYVLDVSMVTSDVGTNLLNEAYGLISQFNEEEKIKANVALVIFSNGSKQIIGLTDCSTITSETYMRNQIYSFANLMWIARNATGSNLESALLMAKDILDNSTTGSKPEDRHVIMATDGGNYTYNNANGETATTVYKDSNGTYKSIGNGDSSGDFASTTRDTKMVMYYEQTGDYGDAFAKLMQEEASIKERALVGYKWKDTTAATIEALIEAGELTVYDSEEQIANLEIYPYTNLEVGTASAAMALKNIKNEGYKIHTIGYLYSYGFDSSGNITNKLFGLPSAGFLKWTENVGDLYFHDSTSITAEELTSVFSTINSRLIKNIESGSYIVDEMGYGNYSDGQEYDLDFVNDIDKINIKFDGEVLDKELIENNMYGFGKDDTLNEGYKFILTYYPNGLNGDSEKDCFRIDINFEIGVGIPVEIEYHEVLGEAYRKTKNGDYGKYDKDGSKKYSSIKANKSATLYFTNEDQSKFLVPTLSYTVDNPIDEDTDEDSDDSKEESNSSDKSEENNEENSSKKQNGIVKTEDMIWINIINILIATFVITIIKRKRRVNKRVKSKH